jgi:ribosomal protein L35AE/L33A
MVNRRMTAQRYLVHGVVTDFPTRHSQVRARFWPNLPPLGLIVYGASLAIAFRIGAWHMPPPLASPAATKAG